jgi:hypothetical protein
MADSKFAQANRNMGKILAQLRSMKTGEQRSAAKIPPREPGSEQSYTFKSPKGTRYSDKKKAKKGERRVD